MSYLVIRYRDEQDYEGYALLPTLNFLPGDETTMIAFDPRRGVSFRIRRIVDLETILDVSKPYQRDRMTVLGLIARMPATLEKLKVLNTICDI